MILSAVRVRSSVVALLVGLSACGESGLNPKDSTTVGPVLEHYTVTGTFTLDTTIETVGPPRGSIITVSTISAPITAELTVTLPYGPFVLATLSCNVCDYNVYTTALHDGPSLFSRDSVNLWMTIPGNTQPILVFEGSRISDTVTGTVRSAYSTSISYRRRGTFSAVRHQ